MSNVGDVLQTQGTTEEHRGSGELGNNSGCVNGK